MVLSYSGCMSELERFSAEEYDELSLQMKMANTARFKALLDSLEPYVDGSMGAVSPPHVTQYVKVAAELGKLWHAYDRPARGPEGVDEAQEVLVLEARQAAVVAELAKLREVSQRRG